MIRRDLCFFIGVFLLTVDTGTDFTATAVAEDAELNKMRLQYAETLAELNQLKAVHNFCKKENQSLTDERDKWKREYDAAQGALKKVDGLFGRCSTDLKDCQDKLHRVTKERDDWKKHFDEAAVKRDNYRIEVQNLSSALTAIKSEHSNLQTSHANLTKAHSTVQTERNSLVATVKDIEDSHAALKQKAQESGNQVGNLKKDLNAALATIMEKNKDLQNVRLQEPEQRWLLHWLGQRFPGRHGNVFDIEAIVRKLGGTTPQQNIATHAAPSPGASGYLLLKMSGETDQIVRVGDVRIPVTGERFQLLNIPMKGGPRIVTVKTNAYETSVQIRIDEVTTFDIVQGAYASVAALPAGMVAYPSD